jgi:hypothetical protein
LVYNIEKRTNEMLRFYNSMITKKLTKVIIISKC